MTFKQLHTMLLFIVCAALAACTDEVGGSLSPDYDKTPIELSLRGMNASPMTRTVITDGTDKTNPFTENTRLYLYLKSEDGNQEHGHIKAADLYALTCVSAAKNPSGEKSNITTKPERQLYWDDAHARDSKLTVYACGYANHEVANMTIGESTINGSNDGATKKIDFQTTSIATTVDVIVGRDTHFDEKQLKEGDFVFSNNIANNTSGDHRLKFHTESGEKYHKFDKGELIFYHALSKLTFHVVMGEGFTNEDFKFKTNTNIALKGFYGKGTFNLANGEFNALTDDDKKDFSYIAPQNPTLNTSTGGTGKPESGKKYYELTTYLVPGTDLTASPTVDDALTLIIKDSPYKVSMRTLYDKILANVANQENGTRVSDAVLTNGRNLKAGVNYLFTLTIGKAGIDNITAQVAEWENVTADNITPTNARIKLQLEERGSGQTSDVAFYKAEDNNPGEIDDDYVTWNWKTGYTNLNATYSTGHWTTNYFWESNKDFYHFRALMPDETSITEDGSGDGDYATLTSTASYTDVRWGAPMKDDGDNETAGTFKWTYDLTTYGFDNVGHTQIYKAIGPTEDPVKLILFHMMSDLTFTINTTNTDDKVELCHEYIEDEVTKYKRTRLDLVGFYNGGKVLLGSGLVKTTGSASTVEAPVNVPFNSATDNTQFVPQVYKFGAVPQALTSVKLRITTPDNNQYTVDLKNAKTSSITTNNLANPYQLTGDKYIITHWYPGFKYNYSFTLKKSGITNLTATIVEWETVTTDNEDVQIQ